MNMSIMYINSGEHEQRKEYLLNLIVVNISRRCIMYIERIRGILFEQKCWLTFVQYLLQLQHMVLLVRLHFILCEFK